MSDDEIHGGVVRHGCSGGRRLRDDGAGGTFGDPSGHLADLQAELFEQRGGTLGGTGEVGYRTGRAARQVELAGHGTVPGVNPPVMTVERIGFRYARLRARRSAMAQRPLRLDTAALAIAEATCRLCSPCG